jgi:hypothetical protein
MTGHVSDAERLRRWALVLGAAAADDEHGQGSGLRLSADDRRIDAALAAVYDQAPGSRRRGGRSGGLGKSAPAVARWLGDVRRYFPTSVVQVVQRDAIERLDLRQLLLEPEMLSTVEADLHLVRLLVELNKLLPDATRATARQVVSGVLAEVERRLVERTRSAVHGALARSERTRRPRHSDIDWGRTIQVNLSRYVPEHRTVIPDRLVGYGRRQRSLSRDVIVAVDQSGSMLDSLVYAAVFGAVLASIPALSTKLVAFDTAVADLSHLLHDPVDLLFGLQLGGGTDIAGAMEYVASLVSRPADTVVVLITDLFEGGNRDLLEQRVARLVQSAVTVVCLLALSDEGAPVYDHEQAARLASLGVASFACTPDLFPDLVAAALERRDLTRWAGEQGLVTTAPHSPPSP